LVLSKNTKFKEDMIVSKFLKIVLLVVAMLLLISGNASARFISEQEARIVVQNWLDMTPTETLSMEGTEIREVMHFSGGM